MNQDVQVEENIRANATLLSPNEMRIGELLVREGFLKEKDVQEALAIQRREAEISKSPLGRILVETGVFSEADLERLLDQPELKRNIGSLAVDKGLVSQEELEDCLRRKPHGQRTGEVLISEGLLTSDDLQDLLKEQMDAPRLGELAVQLRMATAKDVESALKIQKSPRVLGEILCDLGLINPLDLYFVLNKYKKQFKLGEMLVKLGYLDKENLNKSLQEQKHGSDSLGEILVRKKLITTEQLQEALSRQSNIPFDSLDGFCYNDHEKKILSSIISQKYAEKNMMLPISLRGKELTVGIMKPEKIYMARELRGLYNHLEVSCLLITEQKFSELFEVLYSKRLGGVKRREKEDDEGDSGETPAVDFMQIELDEDMDSRDEDAPVYDVQDIEAEEIVNFVIKYGISNGASDIHIEQDREGAKLRYRIDGVLRDVNIAWLRRKLQEKTGSIISRIKIISNLDIAERRLPQDGVFRINYFDKAKNQKADLDFRVATCKGISGENVVIRILDSRKANVGLESLNHSPHVLKPFKTRLKSSAGMILVTGPTGSGKTSTLYGALKFIYDPTIKIITAEDPIEYSFPGIMQAQVNQKINVTFSRLLRSFLRLDPDVILVGEIRDDETAKIGFDAAQTGHLVLSTLHTNDSVSSISRLLDLEVERAQIASCLTCVLGQRLVRRICPSCTQEYVPEEEEWYLLFDEYPSNLNFYKGTGCESCGFTGFKGRTLLSEVFLVDKDISKALTNGAQVDELKSLAIDKGMKTMLDDGLLKLGDTTLSEIIRVIPHEMIQEFRTRQRKLKRKGTFSANGVEGRRHTLNEKVPDGSFVMSDPKIELDIIDEMHKRYMTLASETGSEVKGVGRSLFGEFVCESFDEIRAKYLCKRVIFAIGTGENAVEISAIPSA
jgi:type II secretory ATPase GspE/PulE/Tfp pilus assembly ATPase PilB-like protein